MIKLKDTEIIVWKRCKKFNLSKNDFKYPKKGLVECSDWKDTKECGNGLHGWTKGFESFYNEGYEGNIIILLVNKKDGYVELYDKVKFKKGRVLLNTSNIQEAHSFIKQYYLNVILHWSTNNQGYNSTNKQGYNSTNKQGNYSTNTQGYNSTNKQGSDSTNTIYGCNNISKIDGLGTIIMFYDCGMTIFRSDKDFKSNETIKIEGCEIVNRYTTTPDNIKKLKDYEIFVFGSNKNGNHIGGSAKLAKDKFGAVEGGCEGLQGQSYAFPTLNKGMKKQNMVDIEKSVEKLIKCANENKTKIFLLTKIGCGIAGFEEEEIKGLFKETPVNIIKPKGW